MLNAEDVRLCSRALMLLGAPSIASFDDGTDEAALCSTLYQPTLDDLLVSYPWKFASAETTLGRLLGTPVADYAFAYQLPAGLLRVLSAGDGVSSGLTYRIRERRLETDAANVTLSYIFRPDESAFPVHFTTALVAKLAATFALPLTESSQRAHTSGARP